MNKSHLTAISRKKPSLPLRVLMSQKIIKKGHRVLDFGCGRGADHVWLQSEGIDAKGYDPYWRPDKTVLKSKYDVVLCSYVLNVVNNKERARIITQLKSLTKKGGSVYITVRRDMKEDYVTKKGTQQYLVYLPHEIINETSGYCIYKINP